VKRRADVVGIGNREEHGKRPLSGVVFHRAADAVSDVIPVFTAAAPSRSAAQPLTVRRT
jgi:hypothetical protein